MTKLTKIKAFCHSYRKDGIPMKFSHFRIPNSQLLHAPYSLFFGLPSYLLTFPTSQRLSFDLDHESADIIPPGQAFYLIGRTITAKQYRCHACQNPADEVAYALGGFAICLGKRRIHHGNGKIFFGRVKSDQTEMPPANLSSHRHHKFNEFMVRKFV